MKIVLSIFMSTGHKIQSFEKMRMLVSFLAQEFLGL